MPNHSHHKPGRLPRQAPQGRGPVQGWKPVRLSLEAWLGSGLCCHGDLQLPEPLLTPGDHFYGAGWDVGEVLSPVESCQQHGYLFSLKFSKSTIFESKYAVGTLKANGLCFYISLPQSI